MQCDKIIFISFFDSLVLNIVNKSLNNNSFSIFTENLKLTSARHSHNNRLDRDGLLFVSSYNSDRLRRRSTQIHVHRIHLQDKLDVYDFLSQASKSLYLLLSKFFMST